MSSWDMENLDNVVELGLFSFFNRISVVSFFPLVSKRSKLSVLMYQDGF